MREAVRPYVGKEENREAFRRDGARDWNAYQVTGRRRSRRGAARMPRLNGSLAALQGVQHRYRFLAEKNRAAAMRAVTAIRSSVAVIVHHPEMGRRVDGMDIPNVGNG